MLGKIKNNKLLIIISVLLLIVIVLITKKIALKEPLLMDQVAEDILVNKLRNNNLTPIMRLITSLSNTKFIVILSIVLMITFVILKRERISQLIIGNLLFIVLLNQIIKFMVRRDRPTGFRLIKISGYSFPSGHSMVSMAFYGLLIYIISRLIKNKELKIFLITLNVMIIILVGISRVYVGVHYLSDVVTGYSISLIHLLVLTKILDKYKFIT